MAEPLVTDEIKAYIGRENPPITEEVVWAKVRDFAVAVRFPDPPYPLHFNEEFAKKTKWGRIIAPPTFVASICRAWTPEQKAGYVDIPLKGKAGLNMGLDIEFLKPVYIGDTITKREKIVDIWERSSPSNRLVFTKREQTFTNQNGEVVTIIYQHTARTFDPVKE